MRAAEDRLKPIGHEVGKAIGGPSRAEQIEETLSKAEALGRPTGAERALAKPNRHQSDLPRRAPC